MEGTEIRPRLKVEEAELRLKNDEQLVF